MKKLTLNTHDYDRLIKDYAKSLINKIGDPLISYENAISDMLRYTLKNQEYGAYNSLLLIKRSKNNYDHSDNIDIKKILSLIWDKIHIHPEEYDYIFEQISDIAKLGPCPQGRSKRLFQVLASLYS
jgi:hypothetical protein